MDHLGKTIRVGLTDGRTLYGSLLCFNQTLDIILGEAYEQRIKGEKRLVGYVVVPGHLVQKVSLQQL